MEEQALHRYDEEYAEQALAAMQKASTVTYPPQLLQDELSDMLKDLDTRFRSQGMNLAEYLKAEKKTEQELRSELEPRARQQLERGLVLYEIVEAERLGVADGEVARATERMAGGAGAAASDKLRQALEQPQNQRRIAFNLLTEKALQQVGVIARGQAGPIPAAEAQPEATQTKPETDETSQARLE